MHFQIPKTRLNFSDMKEIVSRTSLLKFWSLYNLFPLKLKQTQTTKHLHFKLFNLDYVIGVEGGPPFATEQLLRQYSVMSSSAWNHLGVGSYQWAHIIWPVFKIFHSMFDSLFGLILLSANTYFEIPGSIFFIKPLLCLNCSFHSLNFYSIYTYTPNSDIISSYIILSFSCACHVHPLHRIISCYWNHKVCQSVYSTVQCLL